MEILDDRTFLFVIGCPRSGTTMLQVLLSNHPKVATTVELTLFDRYVGPWVANWNLEVNNIKDKDWQQGLPMLWNQGEFDDFLRLFLQKAYRKLTDRYPEATHVLDKHPGYSLHVQTIKRLLPNARFIHMIRDGRDVACSLKAAHETMGFGMTRVADAAALWKQMLTGARKAAEFDGSYLELRYENFLAHSVEEYGKVLDFCGLSWDRDWLEGVIEANRFEKMKKRQATADPNVKVSEHHYRKGVAGSWAKEFSKADRYEFDLFAGDLLRELGYADEGWWADEPQDRVLQPLGRSLRSIVEEGRSFLERRLGSAR